MGLMDILQQYQHPGAVSNPHAVSAHFDEVASTVPAGEVGNGVAEAFKSDQTPPFGEMVAKLFGQSNPEQRAGVLSQLLNSVGPAMLSAFGGGALANVFGQANAGASEVTPSQAAQVTPAQVEAMATHAERNDPGVVDRIGEFYSAHPGLVKTLGTAALTIALAAIAGRRGSQ